MMVRSSLAGAAVLGALAAGPAWGQSSVPPQAEADRARRLVAPAQAPERYRSEIESIQRQQALRSLAGYTEALEAGRKMDARELPPLVRSLYGKLRRSRVRAGAVEAPERATIELVGLPVKRAVREARSRSATTIFASSSEMPILLRQTDPADRAPTLDAQSTDPAIVAKAAALGGDPVRIYNFVHQGIATEIYWGSKKGAVGTLREGAGNDHDQASLLIALLRAAGFDARYEFGMVGLTDQQAATYAGTNAMYSAATLIATAGIPISLSEVGGPGLKIDHAWVRAFVPATAYRGVARPGSSFGWVNLAPALKAARTQTAVDLRDAVAFDFDGFEPNATCTVKVPQQSPYLGTTTNTRPSEAYFDQLRRHIRTTGIRCETLDSAQPLVRLIPQNHSILPAEFPARRVSPDVVTPETPALRRHSVAVRGETSQGILQLTYGAPMPALWGKSLTVVYAPATDADAATIDAHGGLEQTPAYLVRLRAVLKVDDTVVATGAAETPGLSQTFQISFHSRATGLTTVEHNLTVGGVYAFVLDPGIVPADLIGERHKRLAALTGDDGAAEKLHISGLTYFRDLGVARQQIAGLHWHRIFKDVEEVMVSLEPRVAQHRGTPLSIARAFFVLDAALIRSGNVSVDGDDRRRVQIARLVGFESSFLEHRAGELFYGPRQFSAVKLLQIARQGGGQLRCFTSTTVDEALEQIHWPAEFEDRMRDAANRGMTVLAPATGHAEMGLGTFFGFIATDPVLGAGAYIVAFDTGSANAAVNGGVGDAGPGPGGGGDAPGCVACGGNGPAASLVHLLSGNYVHQVTDLTVPARGIPVVFTRTYSAQLGWHHNYGAHLRGETDGSLTYIDETGVPRRFVRDAGGVWQPPPTLFQVIEADGGQYRMTFKDGIVYRFGANGKLLSQSDLNNHQVTLSYGPEGRLEAVSGVGGGLTLGYDPAGRLARVTDPASGRTATFVHDATARLVRETDVLEKSRTYTYDQAGRMLTKTDYRGNLTRLAYDDLGRVVRFEDPEGGVRTYAYDARHRRTVHIDRTGAATLYELNASAQPVRVVDPLGNETRMTYDPRGNKLTEEDARGNTSVSTYDALGNLLTRRDPLQQLTSYTYGAFSRLETIVDAAGTTRNVYDPSGNLSTTTDAAGKITSYVYDDGLPVRITRPGAAVTRMTYSPAGNVQTIIDPENGETAMTYDPAGHLTTIRDPNNRTRTMTVDARGQVRVIADALLRETRFEYDDDGNRTKVIDPELRVTTLTYDRLGRLATTTDALGNVSRQEYDAEGRVTARVDARGHRTQMQYDLLGRLISTRDPLGNETRMGYCADLGQQPCAVVDPLGNLTEIKEDELGREVERRDPLGNVVVTRYDGLGRRERVIDPFGKPTRFGYDALGRLETVTDARDGVTRYRYDDRGNRRTVTDANVKTTEFFYDRANRLIGEVTPITTMTEFGYDLGGNRTTKVDGKRQTTTFVYDPNRRLTDIQYQGGTTAHFEYDRVGNRVLEENVDSRRTMTYDALDRLETVTDVRTGRTLRYQYDAAGNRASMEVLPDGELTRYAWDGRGLLLRITDPEGGIYQFGYDAAGRRTRTVYPNRMVLTTTYDKASRVLSMAYRKPGGEVIESFSYGYDTRGNRTSKAFADGTAEVYGLRRAVAPGPGSATPRDARCNTGTMPWGTGWR